MHRFSRNALLVVFALVFTIEGFLMTGLVTRQSGEQFLASVVSAL